MCDFVQLTRLAVRRGCHLPCEHDCGSRQIDLPVPVYAGAVGRSQDRLDKLGAGSERAAPTVKPLHCPNCDAPVPLGTDDVATCVACGTKVPLPDDVKALRAADTQSAEDRAKAEKLYHKLGKPPSKLLEVWVGVFAIGASGLIAVISGLLALGSVMIIVVALGLELLCHWLAPTFGIDFIDRYGGGGFYAIFAIAVLGLGVLPMMLTSYLQSTGALRLKLQANLAAKRPTRPGFPSTCRVCGAALDVAPGQLGVRCAYCGSDNLVALPAEWVAKAGKRQAGFHTSIVEAAAEAAKLRDDALMDLKIFGVAGAVAILVMYGIGRAAVGIDEDDMNTSWSATMGPPRVMIHWSDGSKVHENEVGELYRVNWIALREDEVLQIETRAPCPTLTVRNTTTFPLLQFEDPISWGIAADGTHVTRYRAPYTGLFEMIVTGGETMRWHIAHGPRPVLAAQTGCDAQ